ncbi:MAG: YggT family protein [Propionibacteriaceae bacterium]|nr:YggT family protein [Propionibacteriaceae bacterium]
MTTVRIVIDWVFWVALCLLMLRALLSWVPLIFPSFRPHGAVASAIDLVNRVTDPPIRWMRRFVPPIRLGVASLDLSLIVWFVVLMVTQRIVDVIL